jgi:hypothetical protein
MPVHVKKNNGGYAIVEKSGKVKGRSTSKRKALISAYYRNRAGGYTK